MISFISDDEAASAINFLIGNARTQGNAKEALILAERMVERVKALQMKRFSDLSVSAQEREARASEPMQAAWAAEAKAAGHYEYIRACKDAAVARLEAWRTLQSNARAIKNV
jgi:uncharacterized protein (DUF305 family)